MSNLNEKDILEVRRGEIKKMYQEFLEGEGKLPEGFLEPYNKMKPSGYIYRGTPFTEYLNQLRNKVDLLCNRSEISDWLFFDGTIEINAAVTIIADWVKRNRKEHSLLKEKCYIGNALYFPYIYIWAAKGYDCNE